MLVDETKIRLSIAQRPHKFWVELGNEKVGVRCSDLQVNAQCQINANSSFVPDLFCLSNPRLAPWKLGFMQIQILETAWAYYRGEQDDHGSAIIDLAAGRSKICRDYKPGIGTVFYESDNIYDSYGLPDLTRQPPWNVTFYFGDSPVEDVWDHLSNSQTNRYNYLHEARIALAFVTTLTEQVSPGTFKHHCHFLWSLIWHIRNRTSQRAKSASAFDKTGSGFWISHFKRGSPHNPGHLGVLNNPSMTPSANDIKAATFGKKTEASTWRRFPRMDQKDKVFN
jgi:hypothetical protein